jgi:osmotically-inducible protein OsmY
MKSSKALLAVASATLLAGAAMADSQSDKQINAQVMAVFQQHPDLGPTLKSHTKNGVVYITGSVATSLQKQSAEELAGGVAGVKKVIDNAGLEKGGG